MTAKELDGWFLYANRNGFPGADVHAPGITMARQQPQRPQSTKDMKRILENYAARNSTTKSK